MTEGQGLNGRILVWGAGAIGGTVGAHLKRAGHPVAFVDANPEHVMRIREVGLQVSGPAGAFKIHAPVWMPTEVTGTYDRILLCVRAHQTVDAVRQLYAHLSDEGCVVSLQNGLNAGHIAQLVGARRTVAGFLNFGALYQRPGHVLYAGRGALGLGELDGTRTPRIEELRDLLAVFEPTAFATANIWGYLWGKLGYVALLFATALTTDPVADCLDRPEFMRLFHALAVEVMTTAMLEKVSPEGFNGFEPDAFLAGAEPGRVRASLDAIAAHNRRSAKTHSEAWQDIVVHNRRTEVDTLVGVVPEIAERHGLETPLLRRLTTMVHEVEAGRRPQALVNLDELGRVLDPARLTVPVRRG